MTPAARIEINGKPVGPKFLARLVSLTVRDEAGIKSDTCEIELDARPDPGTAGFTAPPLDSELQVWLGYEPAPVYRGKFKVDEWTKEGPPTVLRVSAKSAELTSAIKATKTRSHHDTTIGEIVRKIAGEHGLGVSIDEALASRRVEHIDQQTESDMGFLSRLARRNGATFKLADGKVVFVAKGSKILPSGGDKPAVTIQPAQVARWSATNNERGGHRSVICLYMDHALGRRMQVTAGSGNPCHRDRRLYATRIEAESAANATLGDLTRGKVTVDINGVGNPELFAETLVTLDGFDPEADGEYLAKSVTHTFSASGYTTDASLETVGAAEAN